jgi:DNA-directed RNA polymerase specialized sigma24 family protein
MAPAGNNSGATRVEFTSGPVKLENLAPAATPDWLLDHEYLAEAERLARLDVDRQLVDELRGNNFTGVHWDYYATELAKYGLAVLTGWMVRGLILDRARRHAFGGLPAPLDDSLTDHDMAVELAGETVARALIAFRNDVLIPRVWDPSKGASIKTFFIGQCLKQFANVYRSWHREMYSDASFNAADVDEVPESSFGRLPDVATGVSRQVQADQALAQIKDPRAKQAFVLAAAGYSQEEIGRRLNVTTKAVERMIYNERSRQRKGDVA